MNKSIVRDQTIEAGVWTKLLWPITNFQINENRPARKPTCVLASGKSLLLSAKQSSIRCKFWRIKWL